MIIKVVGGNIGLRPEHVECRVLTNDLCVLFVDFSPTGTYKNVEHRGYSGSHDAILFQPMEGHPAYEKYLQESAATRITIEGWAPLDEKDYADKFLISVESWRHNTSFIVLIARCEGKVKTTNLEDVGEE